MPKQDPGDRYSPEPNILERRAANYLAGFSPPQESGAAPSAGADGEELKQATRNAVVLAILAGIISGGLIGGSEIWVRQGMLDGMEGLDWQEQWPYWTGFFVFAGIVSAVEIAFLYWVALRGVVRVVNSSGLAIGEDGYPGLFARGLARGALEFPSPRVEVLGVDPYAYVSRWRLLARNIGYKMKVGVSSFLLRVFLRRVAARLAVRGMVPLVAGPLYAAWNAFIVWRIMREARARALGPPALDAVIAEAFQEEGNRPGERAAAVILQGAGELVRRGRQAHPNYVYLLCRLCEELGHEEDIEVAWDAHRSALGELGKNEQSQVLAVFTIAALLGGKPRRGQVELLREAGEASGRRLREDDFKSLREALMSGREIGFEDTLAVFD